MVSYSFLAFGTLVVAASATYRSDRNYQNCWASNRCGGEGECTKGWCGTNGFCCKKDQIANGCLGDGPPGEIHGCVEQAPATAPPGTPCPSSHPFVYRQEHGYDYCCDATVVSSSNSCPGGFTPCPSKPCQSNSAVLPTSTPTAPPTSPPTISGGGCLGIPICETYCNQWNEPTFTGSKSDARAGCNTDVNDRCIWKGAKKWGECAVKDELIAFWTPTVPPTTVEEGNLAIRMDECSVYRKRRYCRHKADAKKHNCLWVDNQCIAATGSPVTSDWIPANDCDYKLRGDCFALANASPIPCTWNEELGFCHRSTYTPPTTAGTGAPTTIAHDTCGKYRSNVKDAAARYAARIQCIQQPACKWVGGARRGVCLVK